MGRFSRVGRLARLSPCIVGLFILWQGLVAKLKGDSVAHIQGQPSVCNGVSNCLGAHFSEQAAPATWRTFRVPASSLDVLSSAGVVRTPLTYALSAGVKPQDGKPPAADPDPDLDHSCEVVAEAPCQLVGGQGAPNVSGLHCLPGLVEQHCEGGGVTHRYSAEGLISCLHLSACLRPRVSLAECMTHAYRLIFGSAGAEALSRALQTGDVVMPSYQVMNSSRSRVDILNMLWQRDRMQTNDFERHLMFDASPQVGYNLLCGIEKRICFPRDIAADLDKRAAADISACHEEFTLPISSLGLGCATLRHKLAATSWSLSLICGAGRFDELRFQVQIVRVDVGPPRGLGGSLEQASDRGSVLVATEAVVQADLFVRLSPCDCSCVSFLRSGLVRTFRNIGLRGMCSK